MATNVLTDLLIIRIQNELLQSFTYQELTSFIDLGRSSCLQPPSSSRQILMTARRCSQSRPT